MAALAVRLPHGWESAADVLAMCHGLQVSRVDAAPVTTQMVELQPLWDRPDEPFVRQLVGDSTARPEPELTGSVGVTGRRPEPTGARLIDLRPEALMRRGVSPAL
jgi:hypothetical protein